MRCLVIWKPTFGSSDLSSQRQIGDVPLLKINGEKSEKKVKETMCSQYCNKCLAISKISWVTLGWNQALVNSPSRKDISILLRRNKTMNIFIFSVFLCSTVHGFLTPGYSSFFDPAWIEENNERESANSERKHPRGAKKCLEPATCDDCRYLAGVSRAQILAVTLFLSFTNF